MAADSCRLMYAVLALLFHGPTFLEWAGKLKIQMDHLGVKLGQSMDRKRLGRRRRTSDEELLRYEGVWVDTFRGLRDGSPETQTVVHARPGTFVKSSGQDRERLYSNVAGEPKHILLQPKFTTTPDEIRRWRSQVQNEQDQFDQAIFRPVLVNVPGIPSERQLWEALKRASTAAQVRRICSRSKIWLKPRLEFPNGGFIEHWPWRRVLYRDAEKFCRAKLDPRYPSRDQRKSGDYRRVEYFARVMAGLTIRLAPSTAVDMLRRIRHTDKCMCWRCTLQIAPRYPKSPARYLAEGIWFRHDVSNG